MHDALLRREYGEECVRDENDEDDVYQSDDDEDREEQGELDDEP